MPEAHLGANARIALPQKESPRAAGAEIFTCDDIVYFKSNLIVFVSPRCELYWVIFTVSVDWSNWNVPNGFNES